MAEKQEDLAGGGIEDFKAPKIKAIDDAAETHRALVAKRIKLQQQEEDTAAELQKVLHKYQDKLYEDDEGNLCYLYWEGEDGYVAKLKRSDEKVSVTKYKPKKKKKTEE